MNTRALLSTLVLSSMVLSPGTTLFAQDKEEKNDTSIKKRKTVYVPFDKLDEIFEKNDRGIYMSYKEFLELLRSSQKKPATVKPQAEEKPPADWVLVSAGYGGEVTDKVARFAGVFSIEVLKKKGWVEVPLGIDQVAFSRVRVKNKDAIARRRPSQRGRPGSYSLLVKGSGSMKVETEFVVPIKDSTPGERSFTFRLPEAAISSFKVRLPEKGLRVEVSQSLSVKTEDEGNQTVVTAYLKSGGNITVRWWPKPKEVKGQKALLYADTTTVMRIEEGVARTATKVLYRIHQAATKEFDIAFPKEYKILSVTGKNMEGWYPKDNGAGLHVKLRAPVKGQYELTFRLERIVPDITQRLVFPAIQTQMTEREVGTACIIGSKLLKLKVDEHIGATQITKTKEQLPEELIKRSERDKYGPPLAFHTKKAFQLSVKATRVKPEVNGHVTTLATVRDSEISVRSLIRYVVKRRGIFAVKVKLPKSFVLLECGDENTVKDYRINDGILEIEFPKQVLQKPYEILITGQVLRDKNGKKIQFPHFQLLDVKKETGHLAVAALKHLELTTDQSKGIVAINRAQLLQKGLVQQHNGRATSAMRLPVDAQKEDLTLAFKYAKPGGSAVIGVKKRDPKIDAEVRVLANAEEDLLKVEGTVYYTIKYAGVDSFKLKVPNAVAGSFKIESQNIKEKSPKKGESFTTWTVKTQSKQQNSYQLKFRYEIKFADLKPGAETEVNVYPVKVLEVANERGNLALVKHENLVIREVPGKRAGLENRDITELPASLKQANVFRAYRIQGGEYALQLRIIKYDFKAPLGTLINHLHLDEVITKEGTCQTEAWILLQNSTEQFLRVRLPKSAQVHAELRVAGSNKRCSPTAAEGEFKEYLINLASQSGRTEPFLIRLRYDVPSSKKSELGMTGTVKLVTPHFPLRKDEEVPVTRFTRQVVFGPNLETLDFETDMTRHFEIKAGLWNGLKNAIFSTLNRERRVDSVIGAVESLKARDRIADGAGGLYHALQNAELISNPLRIEEMRRGRKKRSQSSEAFKPHLFSKLNGSAELSIGYMSPMLRRALQAMAFVFVIVLGFVIERQKLVSATVFFGLASTSTLVLAMFNEGTTSQMMGFAFFGSQALGAIWLVRGVWNELTVERQKRLIEVLEAETKVARARAAAAEVQSRAAPSTPPSSGKGDSSPEVAVSVKELVKDKKTEADSAPKEEACKKDLKSPGALTLPKDMKALPKIEKGAEKSVEADPKAEKEKPEDEKKAKSEETAKSTEKGAKSDKEKPDSESTDTKKED